jgi:hypothetical protein
VIPTPPSTLAARAPELPAAQDRRRRHRAAWLGTLGLVALFVLLRWNNFNAPLTRDEGEYAYAARLLAHGRLPYQDSFLQKPPMVVYSYALAGFLAPGVFWSPRILAGVFEAFATVLLGYIARREFGPGVALPAMWLMTPMLLLPGLNLFEANTEMFMLLPLLGTIALYVRSRHSPAGPGQWLAAGVLAALALGYKYTALPPLALVFAAWSWEEWHNARNPRAIAGYWLAALLGGSATAALALGPFLFRDGGRQFWECTVTFNRLYVTGSGGFDLGGLLHVLNGFWHSWWLLFLAPALLAFRFERRLGFWAALFLANWLASAGSYYGHYYLAIMPFWALLAVLGLRQLGAWIALKFPLPPNQLRLGLAAFLVLAASASDFRSLVRTPADFATDHLLSSRTFLESPIVAAHLAQLTTASDLVYVAGSEPQILCYADRFSATRFDIAYPLMIPTPLARAYQAEAIHDLQQHPPAAIVAVAASTSWLTQPDTPPDFLGFLNKLLETDYVLLGGCLQDDGHVRWLDLLDPADASRCNMVLYKRKVP